MGVTIGELLQEGPVEHLSGRLWTIATAGQTDRPERLGTTGALGQLGIKVNRGGHKVDMGRQVFGQMVTFTSWTDGSRTPGWVKGML